jgi:hypothetical protein
MPKYKLSEADYKAVKDEMRAAMIACAKRRETITYSDLGLRLETAAIHPHSFLMTRLLNDIGREEIAAGRGILPAVVVRKSDGMPGGGYFGNAAKQHGEGDTEAWWRDDLEALYDYWANNS